MRFEILVGLPGSGKSYYAETTRNKIMEHYNNYFGGEFVTIVDFDKYRREPHMNIRGVMNSWYMASKAMDEKRVQHTYFFDGLFLTNKVLHDVLHEMYTYFNDARVTPMPTVKLVYFRENREACLVNDSTREKSRSAHITIKTAEFEHPDMDALRQDFPAFDITIEERDVYQMTNLDKIILPYRSYRNQEYVESEHWSLGGTWGSYTGASGDISPDKQPESFDEFDKLIEEICPNITFLNYKKVYSACVTVEEEEEHDYYGGCEHFAFYRCDIAKLKEKLRELNIA